MRIRLILMTLAAVILTAATGSSTLTTVTAASAPHDQPWAPHDADRPCTRRSLYGRYGFTVTGTQFLPPPNPPVQASTVGIVEFDGRGNFTGADTASFSGQIFQRTLKGTYVMRPNCTFDATAEILTGTPGLVFNFTAVILENRSEIQFIQTDPGALFTGTLKK
jgi:hypothetical protein